MNDRQAFENIRLAGLQERIAFLEAENAQLRKFFDPLALIDAEERGYQRGWAHALVWAGV